MALVYVLAMFQLKIHKPDSFCNHHHEESDTMANIYVIVLIFHK